MKATATLSFAIALVVAATSSQVLAQTAPVNWSGFYVGGNAGFGWGQADTSQSGSASSFSGAPIAFVPNSYSIAGTSERTALDSVLGGLQAGYNWANRKWIVGAEADIQVGRQNGNGTIVSPLSGTVCNLVNLQTGQCGNGPPVPSAVNGPVATMLEGSIGWFGTIRGRLGYLVNDNLLVFGTGGLAYGRVSVSTATNVAVTVANGLVFAPDSTSAYAAKTNVGFTLGAGLQGTLRSLSPNWTWKVEYLYLDLGSLDTAASFASVRSGGGPFYTPITGQVATHTRFTDNIVRVGLNYQFH